VRARDPQDREMIEALMRQITHGIATAHGITAEMTFNTEFIETINAPEPTEAVVDVARSMGLDTLPDRPPMSFSEDFAHFAAAVPACFLLMGNGDDGPNAQPLHSSDYDFNDALLPIGAEFWVSLVRNRLSASA